MRITYRDKSPEDYWKARWNNLTVDAPAQASDRYPLLYAEMVVPWNDGPILELGCGPGRLLRYYHDKGTDIVGVDSVKTIIQKLKSSDPRLNVIYADARDLPFDSEHFSTVLCFGVYHSLEHDVCRAISETYRVLRPGGLLCAEFRSDSIHNRIIDWYKGRGKAEMFFHKCNYTRQEARNKLLDAGFKITKEMPSLNMSILYHVPYFRHSSQRFYDQHTCRAQGYRLKPWIEFSQHVLMKCAPQQMSNLNVFICQKPIAQRISTVSL